jgi:hypothetical protein
MTSSGLINVACNLHGHRGTEGYHYMCQILPCLWTGDYSAKDVITLCQSEHSQYSDCDKGKVHRPQGMPSLFPHAK